MRILWIHDKPHGAGGIRRHVDDTTRALERRGHDVLRLRLEGRGDPPDATDSLVAPRSFGPLQDRGGREKVLEIVRRAAPELVHVQAGFTALCAGALRRLRESYPVVGTFHDVVPFCYAGHRRFRSGAELCTRRLGLGCVASGCHRPHGTLAAVALARQMLVRAQLLAEWRQLDRVVVPSRFLRDLALTHGFEPARVSWIPHFTDAPIREATPDPEPPVVLFVGSLTAHKGVDLLLEALARLTDRPWRAVVVGDGPLRDVCRDLAARLGIAARVHFEGRLADAALERAFAACSLVAFPSRVAEGFGLVGIEALARGKPVVGFAAGGAGEWLHDGTSGLAAPELSSASLAEALGTLLADRDLRARLGAGGRRLVAARFSEEGCIASLLEVYGDALRLRAGRRAA